MRKNKGIEELYEKVAMKNKAEVELEELLFREEELAIKVEGLRDRKIIKQSDVDKLEGRSLTAFFYNVTGRLEQQLEKEKKEAYEAAVLFDAAVAEYEAAKEGIERRKNIINELASCEEIYAKALKDELEKLKGADVSKAEEIIKLEEEIYHMKSQIKECDEAISAGKDALEIAYDVKGKLDSADSWNAWDTFGGGGFIAHVAKYRHIDEAQKKIEMLSVQLCEFKTELTDIYISSDINIQVDGFTKFADYVFDNIFTDLQVGGQIRKALEQINNTIQSIENIIDELEEIKCTNHIKIEELNIALEKMVLTER